MVTINTKKIRSKEQIQDEVTRNYLALADFVVTKRGPVKSYQDYAKLTGILPQNFGKIQQEERKVPIECAILACDVFGCAYNWMFHSTGEMFGKDDVMQIALNLVDRVEIIERKLGIKKK